ncbi:MAG: hypothetical protein JSV94_04245 [Methanobacteriota archaeon]|nr:MAG: hypothetical protein JSV94_04245 [Euryarchaeota archaeon]
MTTTGTYRVSGHIEIKSLNDYVIDDGLLVTTPDELRGQIDGDYAARRFAETIESA